MSKNYLFLMIFNYRAILLHQYYARIKEILDIIVNPNSVCYRKFIPHSFATTCYNTYGYDTFEIAFKILEVVRTNISNPLYADYEKWLIEEQGYK